MKSKVIFTIVFSMIQLFCMANLLINDRIDLPKKWKFQTSDNPAYSKSDFNDNTWKTIQIGKPWET